MTNQIDREYRFIIGDVNTNKALEIRDHNIDFDINRSSDYRMKTNSAAIGVYNLSDDEIDLISTDFIAAQLEVKYKADANFLELFSGQVVKCSTRKSGADRITQIIMGEGYVDLTQNPQTATIPEGKTVKDVLEQVAKNLPSVKKGSFTGINMNSRLLYGYPITGNAQQILNEICKSYGLKYHVHNKKLYVYDNRGSIQNPKQTAPLVTKETGLIDTPFAITGDKGKKVTDKSQLRGIQFKKLIDTTILCGQIIRVTDGQIDGWYVVDEIRYTGEYRGSSWYMDVIATEISDFNIAGMQSIIEEQKRIETEAMVDSQLAEAIGE